MKRNTKIIIGASIGLIAISGAALAAKGVREHREMHRMFSPQKLMEQSDTNKDNAVDLAEMENTVSSRFDLADSDKDGSVTKGDVIAALDANVTSDRAKRRSGRIADRLFISADINEDGTLTRSELTNRLAKIHALADWNDDGKVSKDEMKRMRTIMPGRGKHRNHNRNKSKNQ